MSAESLPSPALVTVAWRDPTPTPREKTNDPIEPDLGAVRGSGDEVAISVLEFLAVERTPADELVQVLVTEHVGHLFEVVDPERREPEALGLDRGGRTECRSAATHTVDGTSVTALGLRVSLRNRNGRP
jgi:hypothetical protein